MLPSANVCSSLSNVIKGTGQDHKIIHVHINKKVLTQGYRYHKLRKTFGMLFRSYSELILYIMIHAVLDLLSKFSEISFQEYVSEEISYPVIYGYRIFKLRRVKCVANFVSWGSKIPVVKCLPRRKYDPVIIERTIGLVLGPSTALYRSFQKRCTLNTKAVGTIWRDLSKPRGDKARSSSPLIVSRDSFSPWTWVRFQSTAYPGGCLYIFFIYCFYHLTCLCTNLYGLSALVSWWFCNRSFCGVFEL